MKHSNRLVNMSIETCADDITQLRKCDVERAMAVATSNGSEIDTFLFILAKRPDLENELNKFDPYNREVLNENC